MKKQLLELHKSLLFNVPLTTPSLKTYAIMDTTGDESIHEKMLFSGLNYVDLWHEDLWEHEFETPLSLVELDKENDFTDYLLNAHEDQLAIYFISPYDLYTLQEYYSKFNYPLFYVDTEKFQGMEHIYLYFYKASILPNYINTLYSHEKVDEFFAGVALWLVPDAYEGTELYLAFKDKNAEIDDVNIELETLIDEPNPMLNFDTVSFPSIPNLADYAHDVTIDETQLNLFKEQKRLRFVENTFEWAEDDEYTFMRSKEQNTQRALQLFDESVNIGIESELGSYRYIVYGLLIPKPIQETPLFGQLQKLSNEDDKLETLAQAIWNVTRIKRSA